MLDKSAPFSVTYLFIALFSNNYQYVTQPVTIKEIISLFSIFIQEFLFSR